MAFGPWMSRGISTLTVLTNVCAGDAHILPDKYVNKKNKKGNIRVVSSFLTEVKNEDLALMVQKGSNN
jgi:hypothetical protein